MITLYIFFKRYYEKSVKGTQLPLHGFVVDVDKKNTLSRFAINTAMRLMQHALIEFFDVDNEPV